MTASHSSSVIENSIRSRRMPALLTTTSSPPNVSIACCTRAPAAAKSETSALLATASPPAAVISATTSLAGPASPPVPSRAPPRSLTTTLAPCSASISECSRPIPRAPPGDDADPTFAETLTSHGGDRNARSDRDDHARSSLGEPAGHPHGSIRARRVPWTMALRCTASSSTARTSPPKRRVAATLGWKTVYEADDEVCLVPAPEDGPRDDAGAPRPARHRAGARCRRPAPAGIGSCAARVRRPAIAEIARVERGATEIASAHDRDADRVSAVGQRVLRAVRAGQTRVARYSLGRAGERRAAASRRGWSGPRAASGPPKPIIS